MVDGFYNTSSSQQRDGMEIAVNTILERITYISHLWKRKTSSSKSNIFKRGYMLVSWTLIIDKKEFRTVV